MSQTYSLYIVDEGLLPEEFVGEDEEIFQQLVGAMEKNGRLHQVVEMTEDDFVDALESIDTLVEGNRLLPNSAMNNSPFEVLDKMSDCPYFGYFSPAQAQQLYFIFEHLTEEQLDTIQSVETHAEVYEAFNSAASEASGYESALAVIHG